MQAVSSKLLKRSNAGRWGRGFTLIEILIVIAIMGIVAAIGIPPLVTMMRRGPMHKAVREFVKGCHEARLLAIMDGQVAELDIRARDGKMWVRLVPASELAALPGLSTPDTSVSSDGAKPQAKVPVKEDSDAAAARKYTAQLPDSVAFKQLVINRRDMMDASEAHVRFYPNGTCDELEAKLLSEQNKECSIHLEMATGRETVQMLR